MAAEQKEKPARKTTKSRAKTKEESLTAEKTEPQAVEQQASGAFPIVGIGASAGGLAAFEAFFSGMPADTERGWLLCWCSTWPRTTRAS